MPSKSKTKNVLEEMQFSKPTTLHDVEQMQFSYDKIILLDQLAKQEIIALRSQLDAIDSKSLLQFKEFEIRELKLRLLKEELLTLSRNDADAIEQTLSSQNQEYDNSNSVGVQVASGSSKKSKVQKVQQSSLFEALSPAYNRKPEKSSKAKEENVGSASLIKRLSSESNGQKKKARASTSEIPDRTDFDKEQIQKLRRRTTTPGKSQKPERMSIGSSSSKKNVKSKPKFASKPPATSQQNPFAAFDMTRRLSAPKLKTVT